MFKLILFFAFLALAAQLGASCLQSVQVSLASHLAACEVSNV